MHGHAVDVDGAEGEGGGGGKYGLGGGERGTYPDSICFATRRPAARSVVKTEALSPYSVSFAIWMASSSESTENKETVGPKDSW